MVNKQNLLNKLLNNVLINDEQTYSLYFKYQDQIIESYVGSNINSNYRLASVSKQFIAWGIINLIKQNKLNYNTYLNNIFTNINLNNHIFNKITINHLLTHTSGLPDYDEELEDLYSINNQIKDYDVLDYVIKSNKLLFEPGSKYQYSNTGYILLGIIIEIISKQNISDYLKKNIFDKLTMNNTCVNYQNITNIKNRMYGHTLDEHNNIVLNDQYWCSATIGDGGIYSNINDLIKWINYLKNTEYNYLLNNMLKPNVLTDDVNYYYGMGMRITKINNNTIYTHSGFTIGTNTIILFSKDLDLELIFLTNVGPTDTDIIIDNIKNILNS